ncbi:MAG: C4-type zinc ribbon domain-containing protein [Caldilineales bacterium]|nr:C4-type zinc ribbon domain-containing protein [Caldilineales bacterium]MDW8318265.1 C4-type zinc ribbon domain-containing protein [Anaerolineae bacterium]
MSTVADLWALQVTDTAVESLRRHLADLQRQIGETEELRAARAALAQAEAELARWSGRLRALEMESRDLARRIQAEEQDLLSGRVRNPKELANMEAHVASLRRHRAAVEDQVLEAMVETERCQAAAQQARAHLKAVEEAWQAQQEALARDRERSTAELQSLTARLQGLWAAISPADRELYRSLRSRKGGRAVVLLLRDTCQGCGMTLPTGVIQQVRAAEEGGSRVFCPTCGRLLHHQG